MRMGSPDVKTRPYLILAMFASAGCSGAPTTDTAGPCAAVAEVVENAVVLTGACGRLTLSPRVIGDAGLTVTLEATDEGFRPVVSGTGTLRGVVLEGTFEVDGEAPMANWRQGFQSWSWSGVTSPGAPTLDDEGVPLTGGESTTFAALNDTPWSSWWVGLAGRADGGAVVAGALAAERFSFTTHFADGQAWLVWGHRGESVQVEGSTALEPARVALGDDAWTLMREHAAAVAGVTAPRPVGQPPTGWATWYVFYDHVDEDDVRSNLAYAEELRASGTDLELFQVDDGWQTWWGDWTAGDDFPGGTAQLATDIAAAGFTPGLWMAPLYVDKRAPVYSEHPDWWVLDEQGEELVYGHLEGGDMVIVDVTHPDAGPWMAQQVADRVAEGWTYLKLDFLYAGAEHGVRHQDVTGLEAYRIAMDLLREAAGDSWVLACGAPMLPSVGYAESWRHGADIAFTSDPDPQQGYYRWQARASAASTFANGIWWWTDPDQLIIREPFTDVQARGAVASVVAAGGPILLGDDLPALSEERLSIGIVDEVLALRGLASEPVAPLAHLSGFDVGPPAELVNPDDRVPRIWRLGDDHVVLLNLSEDAVTVPGPGGTELLTGEAGIGGAVRRLEPGAGEIWAL